MRLEIAKVCAAAAREQAAPAALGGAAIARRHDATVTINIGRERRLTDLFRTSASAANRP